ncbi:hypothetical protein TUM20985_27880 [Mycobacterium antarcticum]|uniref:hypothetical protein n=1 Tax=unclassified Mycolicibacterium TaxID=2636767 RepID=UPI00239C0780|nr:MULTISPECIES: hypothetical protein [unclassified Mycolicibacterium]BDX32241.1 hypothetical protein TUM20985_27880 [Mycolicibacterium sp. TUM20985]GLP84202.1 hypothetical protein TUM20984_56220 [Mycolicibacterium sp. TUM20984]
MQTLVGLVLGVISGVIHPGLFNLLFLTWIIPAALAGLLYLSPRTREVAKGFGAASLAWLAFAAAFLVFGFVGPLFD